MKDIVYGISFPVLKEVEKESQSFELLEWHEQGSRQRKEKKEYRYNVRQSWPVT